MADEPKPIRIQKKTLEKQLALEAICSGRLSRHGIYLRVPAAILVEAPEGYTLPLVKLYSFENSKIEPITAPPESGIYKPETLARFESIWMREDDLGILMSFASEMLLAAKGPIKELPQEKRVESLRRSAVMVVEDLFVNPSPENITKSTRVVGSFVSMIMNDPGAFLVLARLSSHDPYTLQHSVGTAVNSIIVGKKAGISSEDELEELGLAGLLHDIGKTKVRIAIINKEGPLDESEWREMRQHPKAGYDIVKNNPQISFRAKRAILEHHEDKNGGGYPNGLKEHETDLFSKIICICDIFNALTTNRSYAKARSIFDALELMKNKMQHKINSNLFEMLVLAYGGRL
ncbi:MAG: hypothetical protein A2583_12760 [Bdellovibrionales bacterium RIFOXYD1_FULL_53_11]|nr:MAG: hypothetical protein A2583_12760 [Bdellovibrionales bacterium RIFOXYD1_FULL_53_11]